ncbi:MAG: hypothetical protein PVTTEEND_001978, partial [Candidatus Fervidibacter sp.]
GSPGGSPSQTPNEFGAQENPSSATELISKPSENPLDVGQKVSDKGSSYPF